MPRASWAETGLLHCQHKHWVCKLAMEQLIVLLAGTGKRGVEERALSAMGDCLSFVSWIIPSIHTAIHELDDILQLHCSIMLVVKVLLTVVQDRTE